MTTSATPALPQTQTPNQTPPATPAPTQPDFIPSDADGGELGRAALGALKGATEAHHGASGSWDNSPTPSSAPDFIPSDAQGNLIGTPKTAEENTLGGFGTFLEGVNKSIPFRNEINTGVQDAINMIRLGYDKLRGQGKNVGISDVLQAGKSTENSQENIESQQQPSLLRGTGEIAGNVAQFIAGDEALKALSIGEKLDIAAKAAKVLSLSPKMAEALDIGMSVVQNAVRQGVVGGAQTTAQAYSNQKATSSESLKEGAVAGTTAAGVSTLFGALGIAGDKLYEAIASRQPEAIQQAFQNAADQGHQLANTVAGKTLGGARATALEVEDLLEQAKDQMHAEYAHGLSMLSSQAGALKIGTSGTKLQDLVKEFSAISDLTPKQEAALEIDKIVKGGSFSWDEMIQLRKNISSITRRLNYDSPLLRDLGAMRHYVDDAAQESLNAAQQPELAQTFTKMRNTYFTKSRAFENSAVRSLTGKNSDDIADVLLKGGSKIDNIQNLRTLIENPDAMKPIEGQLLNKMINQASTGVEGFNPRSFIRTFNQLSPDVREAFWGNSLPEIEKFYQNVKDLPLTASGIWKGLAGYMMHRAVFDVALRGAGLTAIAGGLLAGKEIGGKEGMEVASTGAILGGVLLIHNPKAIAALNKFIEGSGKVAVPTTTAAVTSSETSRNTSPQ